MCVKVWYDFQQTLAPSSDAVLNQTACTPEKLWYRWTLYITQKYIYILIRNHNDTPTNCAWRAKPFSLIECLFPLSCQSYLRFKGGGGPGSSGFGHILSDTKSCFSQLPTRKIKLRTFEKLQSSTSALTNSQDEVKSSIDHQMLNHHVSPFLTYIGKKAQQKKIEKKSTKPLDVFVFSISRKGRNGQLLAACMFAKSRLPRFSHSLKAFRTAVSAEKKRRLPKGQWKTTAFSDVCNESLTWHHPQTLHLQSLQGMTWDDISNTSHAAIKSASEITVTSLTYRIHPHSPASAFSSWRISSSKSRFLGLTKGGGTGANCLGKANGLASLPENSELVRKEKMYTRSAYNWCGNESSQRIL